MVIFNSYVSLPEGIEWYGLFKPIVSPEFTTRNEATCLLQAALQQDLSHNDAWTEHDWTQQLPQVSIHGEYEY